MNCNNGLSIHFTLYQLIVICKPLYPSIDGYWEEFVRTHLLFQLSKIVTISLNHSQAYDSHLKQDMAAYGTFHQIYISQREIVKREGYHFPIISRLIICGVFQL